MLRRIRTLLNAAFPTKALRISRTTTTVVSACHGGQPIIAGKFFYNICTARLLISFKPIVTLQNQTSTPEDENFDELMDESTIPTTESELALFDIISEAEIKKMKTEASASAPVRRTPTRRKRAPRCDSTPIMDLTMRLRTKPTPTRNAPDSLREAMARRQTRAQQGCAKDLTEDGSGKDVRCESAPLYSSHAPLTLSAVQGTSGLVIGAGGEFAKMGNIRKRPSKPQAHIATDVPEFKDGETISAHGDINIAAGDDGHEWMSAHDDIDIAAGKDGHEEVWAQYTEVETPASTSQQRSLQFRQIWHSITNTVRPLNLPITYYS